jgi:hypothetical protein
MKPLAITALVMALATPLPPASVDRRDVSAGLFGVRWPLCAGPPQHGLSDHPAQRRNVPERLHAVALTGVLNNEQQEPRKKN